MLRALALVAMLATASARAECRWEWLCTGDGACRQMPLCDGVGGKPPPRPESKPPAPPPLAMRPARAAARDRDGLACEHFMRRGRNGRWSWIEACFCVDPAKGADPADPFARIARCESPPGLLAAPAGR